MRRQIQDVPGQKRFSTKRTLRLLPIRHLARKVTAGNHEDPGLRIPARCINDSRIHRGAVPESCAGTVAPCQEYHCVSIYQGYFFQIRNQVLISYSKTEDSLQFGHLLLMHSTTQIQRRHRPHPPSFEALSVIDSFLKPYPACLRAKRRPIVKPFKMGSS